MRVRRNLGVWVCGLFLAATSTILGGCASDMGMRDSSSSAPRAAAVGSTSMDDGMSGMDGWHPAAQQAAKFMMDTYGAPESTTDSMMVWGSTGPWKRTIVYREAVDHNFPMPHPDVLEQFVDFQVPPAMFDELAMFDGSVIVERTKGEMSARCDKEGANFLALNLAHEIIDGELTVDEARHKYGEEIQAMKAGRPTPYTQRLLFEPMSDQRADDPDHAILPM